nr:hypothetical protein CFP56_07645 [Quercus suber]
MIAALQQPPTDHFRGFDDEAANNMMSSLHLDGDEEPRRGMASTSRANSVRFDESANQNHFSHSSRASMDLISRTSSGLGGLHMSERAPSHRSDGRASSAHSIRSAASGRASSLNLDTGYGFGDSSRSPLDAPALAPGLTFLGSAPAIIRCWMNTNFKHDALLYAAVCTGSYTSLLDSRLIQKLGFEGDVRDTGADGGRTIQLPVFFPEAVPHPASSRSSSPVPQLPTLTVNFHVVERSEACSASQTIQIFLGSDVLRQHHADIMFSSNSMTLFDDERSKLSIPLVRPENEAAFKGLYTTSTEAPSEPQVADPKVEPRPYLNGLGLAESGDPDPAALASPPLGRYRPPGAVAAESTASDAIKAASNSANSDPRPSSRLSNPSRPSISILSTRSELQDPDTSTESASQATPLRSGTNSASWGSWRRDGGTPGPSTTPYAASLDWSNAGKGRDNTYQRKETGIKVLKPKLASRTVSSTAGSSTPVAPTSTASPSEGRSRFFDEGRRRNSGTESSSWGKSPASATTVKDSSSSTALSDSVNLHANPGTSLPPKTKANPIGGASAFSWLNSGAALGSYTAVILSDQSRGEAALECVITREFLLLHYCYWRLNAQPPDTYIAADANVTSQILRRLRHSPLYEDVTRFMSMEAANRCGCYLQCIWLLRPDYEYFHYVYTNVPIKRATRSPAFVRISFGFRTSHATSHATSAVTATYEHKSRLQPQPSLVVQACWGPGRTVNQCLKNTLKSSSTTFPLTPHVNLEELMKGVQVEMSYIDEGCLINLPRTVQLHTPALSRQSLAKALIQNPVTVATERSPFGHYCQPQLSGQ